MALDAAVADALPLWTAASDVAARRIHVSENVTFAVTGPGLDAVLRVHRPGYNDAGAIASELAWLRALDAAEVLEVPRPVPMRDGTDIARIDGRHAVMFRRMPGRHPTPDGDLVGLFRWLGTAAARLHDHAARWSPPDGFARPRWDLDAAFGADAPWGDWRGAPGVDGAARAVLEDAQARAEARLRTFGTGPDRFGLIHADMRLANVLTDRAGRRLIDFDDCGFGWHLYDFAAAVSFWEDHPALPRWRAAWLAGYRVIRPIPPAHEAMLDDLILMRRLMLLAWIGTHPEAEDARRVAPGFAAGTVALAEG
ncbi:phosphotransferase enzyme family protein [Jannaschia sp. LMIT008]|uniref:phosphotransferase enzyme family protein n=1 Tax=Jannaschia maritima TaxID=3032585 RepID=UPI002811F87B|nr:phosphotransferase [Jannaschia sp. LMIT008]